MNNRPMNSFTVERDMYNDEFVVVYYVGGEIGDYVESGHATRAAAELRAAQLNTAGITYRWVQQSVDADDLRLEVSGIEEFDAYLERESFRHNVRAPAYAWLVNKEHVLHADTTVYFEDDAVARSIDDHLRWLLELELVTLEAA